LTQTPLQHRAQKIRFILNPWLEMSEAFESKRAPEPDGTFLHAKRVTELFVFFGPLLQPA
jgi:hypothetical protein